MSEVFVQSMFKYIGGISVILALVLGMGLVFYLFLHYHNGEKTNEILFTKAEAEAENEKK